MIKLNILKNLIAFAIGFFLVSLTACQSEKTPLETSSIFWSAIASNDIESIKKYCTTQSQNLLQSAPLSTQFNNATFEYGKILIDGNQATVETFASSAKNNTLSFNTYLIKEDNHWKVNCQRSTSKFSGNKLFSDILKSLNSLGETFSDQLQKQLPLIEKEIESLGQDLKEEVDRFNDELNQSFPQKQQTNPYKNSI